VQAYAEPGRAHDLAVDQAFERLYRRYARDVYRYTLAVLRNPADAEDITQTTFLNAYRAYLRGEEPGRPRHWLIKIAHNACRSRHLRAVRRPQEVPLEESIAALPVASEDVPKVEELLAALGRLPFNQRAALVMRELEGRSYAEIADTLDVSVAAVETLIFRARRTLRKDRSLLGVLGTVQLPPSLAGLFGGGGGGGAVAGSGAALGSGLIAKAALVVAAGVVAGALGPKVDATISRHLGRSPIVADAGILAPIRITAVPSRASVATRTLRGPLVVVIRNGKPIVITEGAFGAPVELPFTSAGYLIGGTAPGFVRVPGATVVAGATEAVSSAVAPVSAVTSAAASAAGAVTAATDSVASTAAATTESATQPVTDAASSVTSSATSATQSPPPVSSPPVSPPPVSPPPVSAPPVSTPPVSSPVGDVPPPPAVTTPTLPVPLPPPPSVPPLPVP
jgi:RNA polymerase sigma factor (sigma-70 family)